MNKNEIQEVEKHNKYVMERMHPAAIIPGLFIAFMVIVGCLFKIYMGWQMKRNRWEIFPQELFQGLKVILMVTFGGIAFLFGALKYPYPGKQW